MSKTELKNKLIKKCISIVKERIDLSNKVMQEAQKNANEYGGPKDRYDPYRNQQMNKKAMYAKQLEKSINELKAL